MMRRKMTTAMLSVATGITMFVTSSLLSCPLSNDCNQRMANFKKAIPGILASSAKERKIKGRIAISKVEVSCENEKLLEATIWFSVGGSHYKNLGNFMPTGKDQKSPSGWTTTIMFWNKAK